MAVTKRMRFEILRRDNHACRYCGATAPDVKLTVDHVLPVALGGSDEPANLVAACQPCNAGKSATAPDSPIVAAVSDDALRWANALLEAALIQEAAIDARNHFARRFRDAWDGWLYDGEPAPLPADWRQSMGRFRSLGLPFGVMREAVDAAAAKPGVRWDKRFNYFCGICWRKIEEIQHSARDLIATEDSGL
jgi:hypothetical protein